MKIAIMSALLALTALAACSSSMKSQRWEAYPGCNEAQCKSWASECSAECINNHDTSVTECENKCNARGQQCLGSCGG